VNQADFKQISHLTFDCYGTLIDWESGILASLSPLLESRGVKPAPVEILQRFANHEAELESKSWQCYREILRQISRYVALEFGIHLSDAESARLPNSLGDWPPFPDTVRALQRLKQRFRLVILSNTDDDLFARTSSRLVVPFDQIITAQQLRSYKPAEAHFQEALLRLDVPVCQILHVAQSLFHDHVPAKRLGFRTALIRRPSLLPKTGLAPAAFTKPDFEFDSLEELADALLPQKNTGAASP
jgi:2-haloacid dehalogenase